MYWYNKHENIVFSDTNVLSAQNSYWQSNNLSTNIQIIWLARIHAFNIIFSANI